MWTWPAVEQPHVVEREPVLVHQRPIHSRVQPQCGVKKVLPCALFGNVEARCIAGRAPRDDPFHVL